MKDFSENEHRRKPEQDLLKRMPRIKHLPQSWVSTQWWKPVLSAALVHLTALAVFSMVILSSGSLMGVVFTAALGAILLAPFYRGLENLVHGASHYDIAGIRRKRLNDLVGDIAAAYPVFQTIGQFRPLHIFMHHKHFNQGEDPCRSRHEVHPDVRSGRLPSLNKTLRSVPRDAIAFYKLVGSNPATMGKALTWHFCVYVLPLSVVHGSLGNAALAWCLVTVPLFSITLPTVRCLAEMGEHDYRDEKEGVAQ